MFIEYCLCGLPVRWNVYLILPVGLACAAKCLSDIACEVCLSGEMFIQYCLCGLPALVKRLDYLILPAWLACEVCLRGKFVFGLLV